MKSPFAAIELKACPFCGKSAMMDYDQRTQEHFVMCTKCRARTKKEIRKLDAIYAWNRRV